MGLHPMAQFQLRGLYALRAREHWFDWGKTPVTVLVPQQLMEQAVAETGFDDFGPDDFRDGLEAYVSSAASEARLNEIGELAVAAYVTENLRRRLKVINWANTHPEVREERIEAPLIVVGLFRAGTTLLSYLLDQDPGSRSLLNWEAADNVPPPTPDTWKSGPRVDAARAAARDGRADEPRHGHGASRGG